MLDPFHFFYHPETERARNEEAERRKHVEAALANTRLAGMTTPSPELESIFEAYIRGEIEACDLVTAYKKRAAALLTGPI